MKKNITKFFALLLSLCMIFGLAACGKKEGEGAGNGNSADDNAQLAGTYDISVWVSEVANDGCLSVVDLTKKQIADFCAANPGIVINATVEGVSESESATQMISSVEDGADIFCFAQDQLSRLITAGALAQLGVAASETVRANNDQTSINAASVNGNLYCYPITSDNGFFMIYDKSVIKAEHVDSLEDILADCEAAGKLFSMELTGSAWYNAAFFFGAGCHSEWTVDQNGKDFIAVDDDFNSAQGLVALKGMQKVLKSPAYNNSSQAAAFSAAIPSAVVVTGTWAAKEAMGALGDNYAATDLPSFTVDGKSYHLGSYSGCKLMGVKQQVDPKRAAVLSKLALYLSSEKCQLERFNETGWGPSNLNAQKDANVVADPALSALAEQNKYSVLQGNISGKWWTIGQNYAIIAKDATTEQELKDALAQYEKDILAAVATKLDPNAVWSIIGSIASIDTTWSVDTNMTLDSNGVWHSPAILFTAGDEFKTRQGADWVVNIGGDGKQDGANLKVEETGYAFVNFTYSNDTGLGTIELVKKDSMFGFTVIGDINGDGWTIDLPMTIQADGSWITDEAYALDKNEFKIRQGKDWNVAYPANNYVVETPGTYYIKLNADTSVELIAK